MPESMRITPVDQWDRVQRRLDRNRTFSPRNTHHEYLLSGLVRCGACGGSYVGNPSHGYFNYVCTRRCGKLPRIRETFLDNSVWKAVEKSLRNPKLFANAIKDIQQPTLSEPNPTIQIDTALDGLATQEMRILEAYQLGVLTAEQLSRELSALGDRRKALENQRQESTDTSLRAKMLQTPVKRFCDQMVARITNLSFETKRAVLRELIRKIVFEGNQVRIVAIVPIPETGEIATTQTHLHGRNLTFDVTSSIANPQTRRYVLPQCRSWSNFSHLFTLRSPQYAVPYEAGRDRTQIISGDLAKRISRADIDRRSSSHCGRRYAAIRAHRLSVARFFGSSTICTRR